ncbi:ATP-binding protein [Gloeocapsopsis dulcis]|uniref:KAP family P-loop domain-containing protein n=1 Tax=Gloeocapsopsis dulcis AAB1 = 1H9 TaxID=1433147 RepID=A0A6N8FZL7_9CHRO|nr:ATP-binding protein [Gloeocapsopsis dulcis]MUL37547.1 KAP family P-loop domain-containing protein [Gloeocapsopsis dulcis AAB1 = 1H9]WNN87961.1 ATP-binding protein [Gloeocapsopsis dulcis]
MASIDQIIQREVNPFDTTTFKPGNFWQEQQDPALNINSIHKEAIATIEDILAQVAKDHRTRTIMLAGDSGSGKSHLLGRLKQTLNPKAFFVYIGPWADSHFIWRHILRQTVDSLLKVPEGQQESQLMLWLKSLSLFKQRGIIDKLLGDRQAFIHKLRGNFPTDIYNANEFFGVLHDLLNPELSILACDWLRGDNLDEDVLKALKVKNAIYSEDAARNILFNFGKISSQTQPIFLCSDNLESIPSLSDGLLDLQALFNVNSMLHNERIPNFLVLISIVTSNWVRNKDAVQPADIARIDSSIKLKTINLDQAEAIWRSRLFPLHQQAEPVPISPIYPLKREDLDEKFLGSKTYPRNTLILGRQLFQLYKSKLIITESKKQPSVSNPVMPEKQVITTLDTIQDLLAAFQLVWSKELQKIEQKITRIRQLSSPELMQMLHEALEALELKTQPRFLPSPTYTSYSLSYLSPQQKKSGIIWIEDPNMTSFFHVMNGCHKAVERKLCQTMFLIRAEKLGSKKTQGYQTYKQIFVGSPHCHIVPDLTSVHYLATYHSLVNAVSSRELVIRDKIPDLNELQAFVRDSQVLKNCTLLQVLGILAKQLSTPNPELDFEPVTEFIMNLVTTQQFLGRNTLVQNALDRFSSLPVDEIQIEQLMHKLCQENKVQILDPNAKPEAQLICLVPNSK